jgi:hypothetical protein
LRLIPFLASVLSVPVFYYFSKIFLKERWSVFAALLLFAINSNLIFYAQELKPYSTDVLCFLLLFLFLSKFSVSDLNKKNIILYILLSLTLPLISFPVYFLFAGWVVREIFYYRMHIKKLILINIPLFILSVNYYLYTLKPQHESLFNYQLSHWYIGLLDNNMIYNFYLLKRNILYFFQPCNLYLLIIAFLITGIFLISINYKRKENSLLLISIIIILFCSYIKSYPLLERSVLFIFPVSVVFIAKTLDLINVKSKLTSVLIIFLFIFAFHNYDYNYLKNCNNLTILQNRYNAISKFHLKISEKLENSGIKTKLTSKERKRMYKIPKKYNTNAKELMKILKEKYQNGDIILVNSSSSPEYYYYKRYYDFNAKGEKCMPSVKSFNYNLKKDFDKYTKEENRYWFFISCDFHENQFIINTLKKWKTKYKTLYEHYTDGSYLLYIEK